MADYVGTDEPTKKKSKSDIVEDCSDKAKKRFKIDHLKNFPVPQLFPPKRMLFLGDRDIGKTSFIKLYCKNEEVHHECEGFHDKRLVVTQYLLPHPRDKNRIVTRIIEMRAGTPEESLEDHCPDEVDLIVLCFSVDNLSSLDRVWKFWLPEAQKYYPDFTRFYLLGLRSDLRESVLTRWGSRIPVPFEMAPQIHQSFKFCGDYMECSVEENPVKAIHLMRKLIAQLYHYEPPPV